MASERKKTTIRQLHQMKAEGRRIAALGVYDAPMAVVAEEIGFEILMIGNSGPMSLFGYRESTRIPGEDLLFMTAAVSRVAKYALVVATMPYMTTLVSAEEAMRTAGRLVSQGGADCVQCHADRHSVGNVQAIVQAGVPVLAHLGLQSVRKTAQSGFGVKGKFASQAAEIVEDALTLAEAGVFALLLELVPSEITEYLREHLAIPVLSLGSGTKADGIYQVSADVVGFSVFPRPKTAAQFVDVRPVIKRSLQGLFEKIRAKDYPGVDERRMPLEEAELLRQMLSA